MSSVIIIPMNNGAISQAAAQGHMGPAIWQLVGLVMILVCLPIMMSERSFSESAAANKRRWALCVFLVLGVPTLVCVIAAFMGAPI